MSQLGGVQDAAVWLASVTAGLAAIGWLYVRVRRTWRAVRRRAEALEALVNHELQPNTGSSMKDALHRLEDALGQHLTDSASGSAEIHGRLGHLETLLGVQAEAQTAIWPAIEAVAKAQPPPEE